MKSASCALAEYPLATWFFMAIIQQARNIALRMPGFTLPERIMAIRARKYIAIFYGGLSPAPKKLADIETCRNDPGKARRKAAMLFSRFNSGLAIHPNRRSLSRFNALKRPGEVLQHFNALK